MGNKVNYASMYKTKEEPKKTLGEIKEELTEAAPAEESINEEAKAEEPEVIEEAVEEEKVEEIKAPVVKEQPKKVGRVTGGLSLNVRNTPNGEIMDVLSNGTQVTIKNEENEDWYEISDPVKGFVMKKFIEV